MQSLFNYGFKRFNYPLSGGTNGRPINFNSSFFDRRPIIGSQQRQATPSCDMVLDFSSDGCDEGACIGHFEAKVQRQSEGLHDSTGETQRWWVNNLFSLYL